MTLRTLLVDDEPLARERIRCFLSQEPDVEVLGECRNGREAVEAIRRLGPDLVFLDIQMPELDGFGVLAELDPKAMPHVIFTTAYDQFAIRAFTVHAMDYLLKPFDRARFQAALQRGRTALLNTGMRELNLRMNALMEDLRPPRAYLSRFSVQEGDRILVVRAEEVECIQATGNYMHLYHGRSSHIIRDTLNALAERLDPARFVRTHRSWILNLDRVREIHHWHKGGYLAQTQAGLKVPVSPTFREQLLGAISGAERLAAPSAPPESEG